LKAVSTQINRKQNIMNTDNDRKNGHDSESSADEELAATAIAVGGTVVVCAVGAVAPLVMAAAGIGLVVLALFAGWGDDSGDGGDGSTAGWGG
jgi:hypothetical protein